MRKKNIFCLICFVMLLLVAPVNVVWAGDVGEGGDTTENPGEGGDTSTEHVHEWEYKKDKEETIIATCNDEKNCTYKKVTLSLTGDQENGYEVKGTYGGKEIGDLKEIGISPLKGIAYYKVSDNGEIIEGSDQEGLPRDPGRYCVKVVLGNTEGNQAELRENFEIEEPEHVHDWKYTSDGDKVKASCEGKGKPCDYKEVKLSLTGGQESGYKVKGIYGDGSEEISNVEEIGIIQTKGITYYKVSDNGEIIEGSDREEFPKDPGKYCVKVVFGNTEGNQAELRENFEIEEPEHVHDWKYTSDGDKVKASCEGKGKPCDYKEVKLSLTGGQESGYKVKGIYGDGSEEISNVEEIGIIQTKGITYYKVSDNGEIIEGSDREEFPKDPGKYCVKVVFGNTEGNQAELRENFEIEEPEHVHDWKYTSDGDKVKASCEGKGKPCDYKEVKLSLTGGQESGYEVKGTYEVGGETKEINGLNELKEKLKIESQEGLKYYELDEKGEIKEGNGQKELPRDPGRYCVKAVFGNTEGNQAELKEDFIIHCFHITTETRGKRDATCTEAGYTGDVYCKICGIEIQSGKNEPKAKGYKWDAGKVTTPSSDDVEGQFTYTCTNGCKHIKTEIIPRKSISIELGKKAKIISNVSVCQKMTLAKASKYKKYLTFNTKTGEIKTKKYYKKKISKSIPVKVFVGGKEYTVNIKIKIPAPKVKITRKAGKDSYGKYYRYTFKYNIKGANKIKVRVENAKKTGKEKSINKTFDKYVRKPKGNKDCYVEFTDKTMKKLKNKKGKVTFKIVAYYGKNQSETLTILK